MKDTWTGEILTTPSPTELVNFFNRSVLPPPREDYSTLDVPLIVNRQRYLHLCRILLVSVSMAIVSRLQSQSQTPSSSSFTTIW